MIFDNRIMRQPHTEANLNDGALWWIKEKNISDPNYFADPYRTHEMEEAYHRHLGVAWSYGEYMADRSTIRRGTYLDKTRAYVHTGVDLNVNYGVKVYAVADGDVVFQGSDYPLVGGWGNHVIQRIEFRGAPHALVYAHLSRDSIVPWRKKLKKGERLGSVGKTRENGFWRPHLHVQLFADVMQVRDWERFSREMDGYIRADEIPLWKSICPDPTPLLFV